MLLLCFVISGISWLTLTLQQPYTVFVEVPVKIVGIPQHLQMVGQSDTAVKLQLNGDGYSLLLDRLLRRRDTLHIPYERFGKDMSCPLETEWLFPAREADDSERITVSIQTPKSIRIQWQQKVIKTVVLRLQGELSLQSAYKLEGPPLLQPDSVQVQGPEGVLDTLQAWYVVPPPTLPISSDTTLSLLIPDTLPNIRVSPGSARAQIQPRKYTQIEVSVPIEISGEPNHVSVRLSQRSIQLACLIPMDGPRYGLAWSNAHNQKLVVKYSDLDEHFPYFTPQFTLPEGIIPIAWSPRQVSFVILHK
ncbi:MAG: hypothetical protein EAZ89_16170 [Bacteroidetes bacterium]|nr:MAG: hypothetical protein EAZ89_16170 [Bacteroidota bacterium]